MYAIQQSFRNIKLNFDINYHIDIAYDYVFPKYFNLMFEEHEYQKNNNDFNLDLLTDDEFLNSSDFSKTKNKIKIQFLSTIYKNWISRLKNYNYGYLLSLEKDVLITSDAYGVRFNSNNIYIPISPSKLIILSEYPVITSSFDYNLIPLINNQMFYEMGLFCVWGEHYKPVFY